MPNPRYQAFVDVAGIGRPNHEYIDFIGQMRRLYAAMANSGSMLITDQEAFTVFVQTYAGLYVLVPAAPRPYTDALIERTEP